MACTLLKVCFPEFTVQRRTLRSHCGAMDKAVTYMWGDKDFVPSCPSDPLCDCWEIPCVPLYVHCLIAVLHALNVRHLVTGLYFQSLCNIKGL